MLSGGYCIVEGPPTFGSLPASTFAMVECESPSLRRRSANYSTRRFTASVVHAQSRISDSPRTSRRLSWLPMYASYLDDDSLEISYSSSSRQESPESDVFQSSGELTSLLESPVIVRVECADEWRSDACRKNNDLHEHTVEVQTAERVRKSEDGKNAEWPVEGRKGGGKNLLVHGSESRKEVSEDHGGTLRRSISSRIKGVVRRRKRGDAERPSPSRGSTRARAQTTNSHVRTRVLWWSSRKYVG